MTSLPTHRRLQLAELFFRHLNRVEGAPSKRLGKAAKLAQGLENPLKYVGMLFDQVLGALIAEGLLITEHGQHHVPAHPQKK